MDANYRDKRRFDQLISKNETTGCWTWIGYKHKSGYGYFRLNKKMVLAHRFSYERWNGLLENFDCLHKCNNPSCVNPEHLTKGTDSQNLKQAADEGRISGQKLNQEQVTQVRDLVSRGLPKTRIAKAFGVSNALITLISQNQRWNRL